MTLRKRQTGISKDDLQAPKIAHNIHARFLCFGEFRLIFILQQEVEIRTNIEVLVEVGLSSVGPVYAMKEAMSRPSAILIAILLPA